jgi:hypothetical protein
MASLRAIRVFALLAGASLLAACGGSDDGDGDGGGGDTVSGAVVAAPWQSYCVATVTSDTSIDDFGDTIELRAGSQFLVAGYEDGFGDVQVDLLYLTPGGPYGLEIQVATAEELPISSNCDLPNAKQYYAVFQDLAVFAEKELTTKLCDLSACTVLPQDNTFISQGVADFSSIDFSGKPQTYEVSLNAFSAQCGGGQSGFISVPSTKVLGTTTWLPGIHWILGPS